ncbi:MAG: repair protein RadC protein [candidate division WWE3 bacterium GW2011_GWC1_41_7]|nr:MAG: repair protein RadC protein [candidate division WWE3 bacterium GW2011_GWB1_41_6]KKS20828.1 MAG: repair protein RadC protein [candidate division WWE3 bacterium GW2011_GWC1_41_7]KKS21482.1 MAG: repair protein RadC protein [candidate division WWE3 bacterium GW2011_GWA1_41_8]
MLFVNDKPRERLLKVGAENLSDTELLAIILRTGGEKNSVTQLAGKILSDFDGLNGLVNADTVQLCNVKDVGATKAATIKAVCEIGLRISMSPATTTLSVRKPEDIFRYVKKDYYKKNKEYLYLISLDNRNKLVSKDLVSIGTLNETMIHPREIYKTAFMKNAASIILVHNHPSGDPTPSEDDIKVTKKIAEAGNLLGITLMDHIIVSDNGYISIKAFDLIKCSRPTK